MSDRPRTEKSKRRETAPQRLSARPITRAERFVQGGGGMSGQDRNAYYYFLEGE